MSRSHVFLTKSTKQALMDEHDHSPTSAPRARLFFVLIFTTTFMVIEFVAGILSNSLALLADAGHMLNDVFSLSLALVAIKIGTFARSSKMTYGYRRVEVLSGLLNGVSLLAIAGYIIYEAVDRFFSASVEIDGPLMMSVAFIGLLVNIVGMYMLNEHKDSGVNMEGAFHHLMADLLGSVAALIAGLGIIIFKNNIFDIVASILVSLLVFKSGFSVTKKSILVLLEASPLEADKLVESIMEIEGVINVCDYHSWRVTKGVELFTAHLILEKDIDFHDVVNKATQLASTYGYTHTTFQPEFETCAENEEHLVC